MGDVANLLVGAHLNKADAASVARQFKSLLDQIEKDKIKLNIDDADLKSKTLEALSQLKELQDADFTDPRNQKALQSFFDGFQNGKKNISDIGALVRQAAKDIKPLLRQATDNPLVNQLTSREKKALAERQEALNLAKENYGEVKKNSKSNAKSRYLQVANEQKQDLKNLQNIKDKFLSKTEKDEIQSGSADRLGQLRSQLGLPDTEDANKILSQYSEVLSVYDKINQKRQKISDLTSEKELDDEVRKLQGLSSTSSYISKLEGVLNKKYGVENFDSPKFKMKDTQFQFVGKYSELMENSANLAVEKARQAVIDYAKKTLNKQQKKNEEALKQSGLYQESDTTSKKDVGVDISDTSSDTDDSYTELRKQALDKIKSEYASYTKYAVEEQEAIEALNKLHKQFKNSGSTDSERYLDDKEIKDVIGYQSRLKSLGKEIPQNISDMMKTSGFKESLEYYNDDTDNISSQKIEKQIESMTAAQTAAMEKLKKARQEINESIGDSGVESTQTETGSSVQNEIQDLSELESKINEINTKLTELNTNLNGVNGQAFEDMKSQISDLQSQLEQYLNLLDRFNDASKNKDIDISSDNLLKDKDVKELQKDSKNKIGLFEESNGQMSMFEGVSKSSDNVSKAQNNIRKQIKNTNDDIKGQISLFDVLKDKEKNQAKQTKKVQDQKPDIDKIDESSDQIVDQSDTSSEISNMQNLSSAVQQVTDSVNNKTLAFLEEEDIVSQVVSSEISAMESLSKSVDEVSKSLDIQKDKLKDHNDDLKDIKDTQEKADDSDSIQKDKKQPKSKNTKSKSTDSTTKQTKTQKTSNIPSTYVKNIDRAFDQASKINNVIDKAESIKAELARSATDTTKDVIDKSTQDIDAILHRLKKTDRPNVASADNELDRIQERTKKIAQTIQTGALFKDTLSSSGISNMSSVISNVTSAVDKLDTELKSGAISVSQYGSRLDNIKKQIRDVDDYADNSIVALSKMHNKLKDQLGDNARYTYHPTRYDKDGNRIESITGSANSIKTTQTWNESIGTIVSSTTKQTQSATNILGSFFDGLKSRWSALGQYILSFGSFYEIWDLFKQGVQISKELDDALTEMNKVSDAPLFKLQNYQKESFDMADEIGSTGVQIQKSTADFLRLGESFEDAKKSAEAANVLYNVSEFESIDAATESLIAMSAAYKGMDKMDINDKLNNIGNNFSISTDGLATALQTSASALTTAGADIDESIALITAGNAVVQDPASVGAGIRTIALRLMGTEEAKEQLETTGEDTSDYIVQTASKIDEAFRAFTAVKSNDFKGISILDENGNNRGVYDILQDVADIYEEIVATDKQFGTNHLNGLLELMAGKQRSNIAASIIQNAGTLRNVYESSQNSEGSALEENQKHLDSIQGHLDQLKNKWQEVWSGAGRDVVNPILDAATGILDIISNLGLLKSTIAGIIGAFGIRGALKGGGIFSTLFGWSKFPGLQLKTF